MVTESWKEYILGSIKTQKQKPVSEQVELQMIAQFFCFFF